MKWYDKQKALFEEKNGLRNSSEESTSETTQTEKKEVEDMFVNDKNVGNEEEVKTTPSFAAVNKTNVTTIQEDTVLEGNITTGDDLVVYGTIHGNIVSEQNVTIYGKVEGTIECTNIDLQKATVNGNITCNHQMDMDETSVVVGDVKAVSLLSGGKIKGNADVEEGIHFRSTAAIIGDISCGDLEIDKGAFLQGNIKITKNVTF